LLNREVNAVLHQPDLHDRLAAQGIEIAGSTPEAVQAVVLEEVARWAKVIKQGNIQPE